MAPDYLSKSNVHVNVIFPYKVPVLEIQGFVSTLTLRAFSALVVGIACRVTLHALLTGFQFSSQARITCSNNKCPWARLGRSARRRAGHAGVGMRQLCCGCGDDTVLQSYT